MKRVASMSSIKTDLAKSKLLGTCISYDNGLSFSNSKFVCKLSFPTICLNYGNNNFVSTDYDSALRCPSSDELLESIQSLKNTVDYNIPFDAFVPSARVVLQEENITLCLVWHKRGSEKEEQYLIGVRDDEVLFLKNVVYVGYEHIIEIRDAYLQDDILHIEVLYGEEYAEDNEVYEILLDEDFYILQGVSYDRFFRNNQERLSQSQVIQ